MTLEASATQVPADEVQRRLETHLRDWLGAWPPRAPVQIVGSERRAQPGWDGAIRPIIGVASPRGAIISVPPDLAAQLPSTLSSLDAAEAALRKALRAPHGRVASGIFRWSEAPSTLPETGVWVDRTDRRLPAWLYPFNGGVLVALDGDRVMAGVGIKQHDAIGHEIAVVTEPGYRGRGLATRLVAQAARHILAGGGVPTYLHGPDNFASARTADAAGFPDRGWRVLMFIQSPKDQPS